MAHNGERLGGGSGGGLVPGVKDTADDQFLVSASQVEIVADAPLTAIPPQSTITLLAAGDNGLGVVDVRGALGVRVSAGPPPGLPTCSPLTNGVEIAAGPVGIVSITQGLVPPAVQKIEMVPGLGVTVNAGAMPVRIESATTIELTVAGGTSRIVLTPAGIEISAADVRIVGIADATVEGPRVAVRAAATATITAPMTMINPA